MFDQQFDDDLPRRLVDDRPADTSSPPAPPNRAPAAHAARGATARLRPMPVIIAVFALWLAAFAWSVEGGLTIAPSAPAQGGALLALLLHIPYAGILAFFLFGLRERIGYFLFARCTEPAGPLPARLPKVCVQLPMFNEAAVATRVIAAAAALHWPRDRLVIQVLDDSTDPATRALVQQFCVTEGLRTHSAIAFIHRTDRSGYKAGALEAGRHRTDADFIAIFDADFVPPRDYLTRAIPHFYAPDGAPLPDLALVQAQWGHLNDDDTPLTAAQALWVDDHHTLQQSWRSKVLGFVNFTGTAGVWRAAAIERAGGWSSSSLVEDCELSVRALFAGYRTKFVKEIVAPAELPQSMAAYRSQQKRWTQGWAQLQRLHLGRLLFRHRAGLRRKSGLLAMVCISWQWPLWFIWIAIFPFLLAHGLSLAEYGTGAALAAYLAPPVVFAVAATLAANHEARASYTRADGTLRLSRLRRFFRVIPYLVVSAGMLPHHFCAFVEGLFGPMHAEFERTPKTAKVSGGTVAPPAIAATPAALANQALANQPLAKRTPARPGFAMPRFARPAYATTELLFVTAQLSWVIAFARSGYLLAAVTALWLLLGIAALRLGPPVAAWLRRRTALRSQGVSA